MLPAILSEADSVRDLRSDYPLHADLRLQIRQAAVSLAEDVRKDNNLSRDFVRDILSRYGLSTSEGMALWGIAESYRRVPDVETRLALLRDKLALGSWLESGFWDWLRSDMGLVLKGASYGLEGLRLLSASDNRIRRDISLGLMSYGLRRLHKQFVVAETIEAAYDRCDSVSAARFSFDMLAEEAHTAAQAEDYFTAYEHAVRVVGECSVASGHSSGSVVSNKYGISVKLSALCGRYERLRREDVESVLLPRLLRLLELCKCYNIGLTLDAEQSSRLELSLILVESLLRRGLCRQWQGLSVVVQAYNKRALWVIRHLRSLAERYDSLLAVRLVKGAYWDSEIRMAQLKGLSDFPVFTRKSHTDMSYICCAAELLRSSPLLYGQFATHNAYTGAAVNLLARQESDFPAFEMQRIYGMGEALHDRLSLLYGSVSRVYVAVGKDRDLLPYLLRRLLENGSEGSFVSQLADSSVAPLLTVEDPLVASDNVAAEGIVSGGDLHLLSGGGCDLDESREVDDLLRARDNFMEHRWSADEGVSSTRAVVNPCDMSDEVGSVELSSEADIALAIEDLRGGLLSWSELSVSQRAVILRRVGDLYEAHLPELLALLTREVGLSLPASLQEVRAAVDFCRYHSDISAAEGSVLNFGSACGLVLVYAHDFSPLYLLSSRIFGALLSGNVVLALPSAESSLLGRRAVEIMHEAGVPLSALRVIFADSAESVLGMGFDGIVFGGSLSAASSAAALLGDSDSLLLSESGSFGVMVVDSTALLEQAVADAVALAFGFGGRRSLSLRLIYVQSDIYDLFVDLLRGAMDLLRVGNSRLAHVDVGGLSETAYRRAESYIDNRRESILHRVVLGDDLSAGYYCAPTLLGCAGIDAIETDIAAPVLHVASFSGDSFDAVMGSVGEYGERINFALHSRLHERCRRVSDLLSARYISLNRNRLASFAGSLAGGGWDVPRPLYGASFCSLSDAASIEAERIFLPAAMGESMIYRRSPRRVLVCGSAKGAVLKAVELALAAGCEVMLCHVSVTDADVRGGGDFGERLRYLGGDYTVEDLRCAGLVIWGGSRDRKGLSRLRERLAEAGSVAPVVIGLEGASAHIWCERHIFIDNSSMGGNLF